MLNSLIIRGAAGATLVVGAVLFAAESGWIGSAGNAQTTTTTDQTVGEHTLSSSSGPSGVGRSLPIIEESNVIVPSAEQSLAPQATIIPTAFDDPIAPQVAGTTGVSALGLPCDVAVSAMAMPAAVVALDVLAPCRADASITINHSGIEILSSTDALGLLTLDIPAFESPAYFSVRFADGVEDSLLIDVPDLSDYDRIGLSWQGDMGLELHAMEFGAGFGDNGHVWQNAPARPEIAVAGEGGFLTRVETGESYVQVYTLPRALQRGGESVRLSIDAPVTQANCAQNIVARTLRAEAAGPVDVRELTFTVPACDAVGEVLVLQNLLDDLRLASN